MKSDVCKRKSYATERAANEFASDLCIRNPSQEAQIAYYCEKCKGWHLCPESRHTPNIMCNYCKDSHKKPKQLYIDRKSAEKRKRILEKEQQVALHIYECPHHPSQYHISKKHSLHTNHFGNQKHRR